MHPRRRRFIKLTATGLVAAPFANALLRRNAAAADMVKESDPAAVDRRAGERIVHRQCGAIQVGAPGALDANEPRAPIAILTSAQRKALLEAMPRAKRR